MNKYGIVATTAFVCSLAFLILLLANRRAKLPVGQEITRVNSLHSALYENLAILTHVFKKFQVRYVAVAGTMLGVARHGGIIPWDDDIDLAVIRDEIVPLFDELSRELKEFGATIELWAEVGLVTNGYKVRYQDSCIDLFFCTLKGEKFEYQGTMKLQFGHEAPTLQELGKPRCMPFGPGRLPLTVPENYEEHLSRVYSKAYAKEIVLAPPHKGLAFFNRPICFPWIGNFSPTPGVLLAVDEVWAKKQ